MIRTRFAPSPTGYMHLGNVWVAFLNWLWTRQHGGKILLRIEDIDRQRCREDYAKALAEDLEWLGLDWDEGPAREESYGSLVQSRRLPLYDALFEKWKRSGEVYPCYCTRARIRSIASAPHAGEEAPLYDGHCRDLTDEERARETKQPSWRIRMGEEPISFTDLLLGKEERTLRAGADDFVLLRADGMISYQLAASYDDGAMGVTHVFRGNDLLSSTFGQIALLRRMGKREPVYAHLPLLVDADGVRLSKRQHGITVRDLRAGGMTAGGILGKLLFLAGGIEKEMPVAAEEARRNISFADCGALREKTIIADRILR